MYHPTEADKKDWQNWLHFIKEFFRCSSKNTNCHQVSPVFVKKTLDNRPYIRLKIFDFEITALLDSGANSSVIGEYALHLLKNFNLNVDKKQTFVHTADGNSQKVEGLVYIPLCLGNVCKIMKFLVVPSLKHSIILGSDFCDEFMLNLNFKNNTWEVQCDNNNISVSCSNQDYSLNNFNLLTLENLSVNEKEQAEKLISSFQEISGKDRLGLTDKMTLHIDTGDEKPFKVRQYPFSPYLLKLLNSELDEMLRLGVVEQSSSPWSSPVLMVKKKSGEYRFCFDGRRLNSITKNDAYPLPRVDRILSMLRNAKYISSIDLRKAFWQIPLDVSSREKTAFSVPGRGLFHFKVVPFGLCNSAQTQQRLMDAVFGPKYEPNIFVYLDDIIIISSTFEHHIKLLKEVKQNLKNAGLVVNLEKCNFFKNSLKYLGFIVDGSGLRTDPEKVTAMVNYPRPNTTTEIKRFLGLCSWYRRFISHFSSLVAPLNDILKGKKKNQAIVWTPEAERSFKQIKEALVSAPILRSPDFSVPFVIQCDASDCGLGGVLTQNIDGDEVVIAFASRSLSRAERNYTVTEKECLAVLFSIEKFRPFVEGTHFKIITDHYSLLWLNRLKEPTGRLARWAVKLQQFSYDIEHRKGKFNVVPDALSRAPVSQICQVDSDENNADSFYVNLRERIKKCPNDFPNFQVVDNAIYKFVPNNFSMKSNVNEWKLFVPKMQRSKIIKECHDPPTSGHFGFYKTLHKIMEQYYWPKIRKDVMTYVRRCNVCASQKIPALGKLGLMGSEKNVKYPFQILAADIMGPLPRSSRGHCYLLVVADWFSKFTLLHPMRAATASNVCSFIENNVFLVYGVPQFVIVDNGTQFSGRNFKSLAQKYKIQKIWYNARYHPQANYVERVNKTVGTAIRSYISEHKDWDKHLFEIQHAINTATHEVTGFTPSFLNFARYVPTFGDYYGKISNTSDIHLLPDDRGQYVEDVSKISDIYKVVQERLSKAYKKNVKEYNLRRRELSFDVGEKVWRRNKILSDAANKFSAKLAPKYVLCRVKKKLSKLVYTLEFMNGSPAGDWHVKDLKPYFGSNSDVSVG